ncbi:MAG: isoleucine--tRNA ligase [Candidatus Woesearchaeota archaeon]
MAKKYNVVECEKEIQTLWDSRDTYQKIKNERSQGKKFYFLDGPPYTSGKVHLGTAWNKSLKDMVLRYKRMKGFNVWDRAGYDMHGLPTEQATEKKLGIKGKEAIQKYGVGKFITECKSLCIENMSSMNDDFKRLGVWMDFENAYQSINPDFIDGEWWLIKKAHEKGRLYQGLRTMTWCPITASAVAKHELEYKNVTDASIFVKFKTKDTYKGKDQYLVIWTTTPWTIPFNLAVMVNPDLDYVRVEADDEVWILSKALAGMVMQAVVGKPYKEIEVFKGFELEGMKYEHFFDNEFKYSTIEAKNPEKMHTVLLSSEYVDTSAGTGLVHCAPGCGPEDYEVGHRNGLPAFNVIDEQGVFPKGTGDFEGLVAKKDDSVFIEMMEKRGVLVAQTEVEHEYPHSERTHEPVVFRTTKQWFFKVEDLKEKMIKENNSIKWVPQSAYNAFNSWLQNLRDNSISKQRYWGTPLPIWVNENDETDYIVVGSIDELQTLSGMKVTDPHIPFIDQITITKKSEKTGKETLYKRVPDILDVWVDAGTASWNCLDYPKRTDLVESLFPADFILEGKDQIRGWFNLLHVAGMISFDKAVFSDVYMHGFIQDSQGRKMSKSLGNYILPEEVISQYGADTFRYYFIGGANPGLDINYNPSDVDLKHKNLHVLWNVHTYIMDYMKTNSLDIKEVYACEERTSEMALEEKYMLSVLHKSIMDATTAFETYRLNEIPHIIEKLYLELSRTYIQLIREKSVAGTEQDKKDIAYVLLTSIDAIVRLFAPIVPFIAEKMYQNLRVYLNHTAESVHGCDWPVYKADVIDDTLMNDVDVAQAVMQGILFAREKAQRGVRWPVSRVIVQTQKKEVIESAKRLLNLIKTQTNVRDVVFTPVFEEAQAVAEPNYGRIAKVCGDKTQQVAAHVMQNKDEVAKTIIHEKEYAITLGEHTYVLTQDYVTITYTCPDMYIGVEFREGMIFLDTTLSTELEAEGFVREVIRRVQSERKTAGLVRTDVIELHLQAPEEFVELFAPHEKQIKLITGSKGLMISAGSPEKKYSHNVQCPIKNKQFGISFSSL